jgi:hypothetical protein
MFEMLVGYPPFYSDDPMNTCRKVHALTFWQIFAFCFAAVFLGNISIVYGFRDSFLFYKINSIY